MRKIMRSRFMFMVLCFTVCESLVTPVIAGEGKYDPLPAPKEGTLTWELEHDTPYWTFGGRKYTSSIRACKDRKYTEEIQKEFVSNKRYLNLGVQWSEQVSARLVSENKCIVFQLPVNYTIVEIVPTDQVINISPDPKLNRKRKLGIVEIRIDGSPNLFMSIMLPYNIGFPI